MTKNNKLYEDLLELVKPRMLNDFCGYDEEGQGFNIVKVLKEILEETELEREKLRADWYDINEQLKDCEIDYERISEQYDKIVEQNKNLQSELNAKELECKKQQEFIESTRPTGICEICTAKCITQNDKYKQVLEKIKTYCDYIKMFNLVNQTNETNPQKILDIINEVRNEQTNM